MITNLGLKVSCVGLNITNIGLSNVGLMVTNVGPSITNLGPNYSKVGLKKEARSSVGGEDPPHPFLLVKNPKSPAKKSVN
ncbi:hypothetical protein PFDG_04850, partial [Plasmodium falciparum Dd2]